MRIELFGIARRRAGTDAVEVEAATLREAMRRLGQACPGLVPEVVEDGGLTGAYLASLNGDRFVSDGDTALSEGDTLLILGSQAGG